MFQWTSKYNIDQPTVDEEHRELFAMINRIGEDIAAGDDSVDELESALDALLDYARTHFADEEAIMQEQQVDPRHIRRQQMEHRSFFYDIEKLRSLTADEPMAERYEKLLTFVTNWLIFHTLRTDQQLGIQLRAIAAGSEPAQAFEQSETQALSAVLYRPVVEALVHLWSDAMERVHELEKQLAAGAGSSTEDASRLEST